jgi:hypothetical protein
MRIKFLVDRTTKNGPNVGGKYPEGEHFKAGQIYDLPDTSAEHWLKRNILDSATGTMNPVAVKVEPEASKAEPKKAAEKV